MNKIRILFSNVGIDKWPIDDKFIKRVDNISKYTESSYKNVDDIDKSKYKDIYKLKIEGSYHPKKENENPYKYGCYTDNKAFDAYLTQFYEDINKSIEFDIVVFQEFCSRHINLFNFESYFMQLYELPKLFNSPNITDANKKNSRKAFLVGSNKYKMEVKSNKDNKSNKSKVIYEPNFSQLDDGYGNIQISKIEIDNQSNNKEIIIINLHNRFDDYNKFKLAVEKALENVKTMKNVLLVGDFNLVFKIQDVIQTYGFTYCENDYCNLNKLYQTINKGCMDKKNSKAPNLQIYYKLSDYNIFINNDNLKCDFDKNISSHIFVDITLTPRKVSKGGKRYKLVI